MPRPRVSLLLLTEDSGQDSFKVLSALVAKMLHLIDGQSDLRDVRHEPATEKVRMAMNFNGWKGTGKRGKDQYKRADLAQAIATALLRTDQWGFVLVHVDGDRPFAESDSGTLGDNVESFRGLIVPLVRDLLSQKGEGGRLDRLVLIVPYACIEAWLYQNVEEALHIYQEHFSADHRDVRLLLAWGDDPRALDEVLRPKECLQLRSQYNLRLATTRFPAGRVKEVGKSFAHAIRALEACADLRSALGALHYSPFRGTIP